MYDLSIARLKGLRQVPVKGFENYPVFYLPHQNGIDVIRIFQAAHDIDNLFAQEEAWGWARP